MKNAFGPLLLILAAILYPYLIGGGGGVLPSPTPSGPYLITAIVESGDTQHNVTIAELRLRDENGWEHDFKVYDTNDADAKYLNGHPPPAMFVEPISGGEVIHEGPFVADVDSVLEGL